MPASGPEHALLTLSGMDAIELLKQQHENVIHALEDMIERGAEIDPNELRLLADELVAHMVIEEHVFYPRVRKLMTDLIKESFEEHIVARFALARAMTAKGVCSVTLDDREEVEATVRSLLVDVLGLDSPRVARFDDETELFGALPEFDSMAVATLLTELEERLGILIEDEDVEAEDLMSFGRLVSLAERLSLN